MNDITNALHTINQYTHILCTIDNMIEKDFSLSDEFFNEFHKRFKLCLVNYNLSFFDDICNHYKINFHMYENFSNYSNFNAKKPDIKKSDLSYAQYAHNAIQKDISALRSLKSAVIKKFVDSYESKSADDKYVLCKVDSYHVHTTSDAVSDDVLKNLKVEDTINHKSDDPDVLQFIRRLFDLSKKGIRKLQDIEDTYNYLISAINE